MRTNVRQGLLVLALALMANGESVWGCNVPVFRFALERWRPDSYQAVLLHRGSLADAHRALIDQFGAPASQPAASQPAASQGPANWSLRQVDLETADAAVPAQLQNPGQLPWLMVTYPEHLRIEKPAWAGPFQQDAVAAIGDSPVRRELVKRLVAGETAVWLVLESGDPEKDQPAIQRIEQELQKLTQELKLPELTDSPDDALLSSSPLRIAFSLLRISPQDPAEQAFAQILLHCEPDLLERQDPLVFPVFGRGRALFPLVGAGINPENIRESASFLVGPCSCQVKELNPGFDLLLAADWDDLLNQEGIVLSAVAAEGRSEPSGKAELIPIPAGSPREPAAAIDTAEVPAAPQATASTAPTGPGPSIGWTGGIGLVCLVVVSLALLLLRR